MANEILYVLNTKTGCISQVNAGSSSANRYKDDATKKFFTDAAKALDAQRKLKK